jgi:predicted homoserine dehydrogenase-like protein
MNLHALLEARLSEAGPIRVGLIGAGKFATMFLSQAHRTPGLHILAVCDLDPPRAADALTGVGFTRAQIGATSFSQAASNGTTHVTRDAAALIAAPGIEVVVDATGDPAAGIRHVLACCEAGRHIVMVNVEADALAGPMLAERARQAGIVYSLAYGDQPALIAEQVDWARTAGFEVVCAGKGTKYLPEYHQSTPDTVWSYYGLSAERAAAGGMNPKMFNSFLDGTKSAIEMAAVANATGLRAPSDGLGFPACDVRDLPGILKPAAAGGTLAHRGMVEVVSSLRRDGSEVARDLRWGVYVVFEAPSDYVARCFAEYGLVTDDSGRYSAMYKPYHLIGLELGISVASVALRGEPTGQPRQFQADVAATAKRDLRAGERLDGEGGYRVWGRLMPARDSLAHDALPIGLANEVILRNDVPRGQTLSWNDVDIDRNSEAVRLRREMELAARGDQAVPGSG